MPNAEPILMSTILLVDDEQANLVLLSTVLESAGYHNVTGFTNPSEALSFCDRSPPDIVLLDLHMPKMDGYEVLTRMRADMDEQDPIPIVVVTFDLEPVVKRQVLALGASELLVKPADPSEILIRVRNLLELRHLQKESRRANEVLENRVRERTREIETSQLESLALLARAAEYRDDATEKHTQRVGDLASRIAAKLNAPEVDPEIIRLAAPLHDIGKIGLPDSILLKPGPLTVEEIVTMKTHPAIGAAIIGQSRSPVLMMAMSIALTHHERIDGTGYPKGLAGKDIPLAGRIVAIADVFDALTQVRPYKPAWDAFKALAYVADHAGSQFDTEVVEAFLALDHAT